MITNFHTHTNYCDGIDTPEEVVCAAIEQGFSAIGISGHGYTDFDLSYCMKDMSGYIKEIKRLKEVYKDKIQVYLGVEEDMFCAVTRSDFEYIIGSAHYIQIQDRFYPVDLNCETLDKCLALFDHDVVRLAENYYQNFCTYIKRRKPDIVGHFDLITKFDEMDAPRFLSNPTYQRVAEQYLAETIKTGCIFEVNTGAISRNYRKTPYPSEFLLHILKKHDAKVMLSSDSHSIKTLDCHFEETKKMLSSIGFEHIYTIYNNQFVKECL